MTIEQTKEAIRIMQGYVDKKPIEVKLKTATAWEGFTDGEEPNWDFPHCNYRIKPKPHYRPFKSAEEVMEAINEHGCWIKTKTSGRYVSLKSFDCDYVWFGNADVGKSFKEGYEAVVFVDGTPFGKLEE